MIVCFSKSKVSKVLKVKLEPNAIMHRLLLLWLLNNCNNQTTEQAGCCFAAAADSDDLSREAKMHVTGANKAQINYTPLIFDYETNGPRRTLIHAYHSAGYSYFVLV